MKIRLIFGLIGLVIFVIAKVFFVDSEEVRQFNDKLVDITTQTDQRFTSYVVFLDQYNEGETVNVQAMRTARDQLESEIRSDLDTIDNLAIPDDELCKTFHRSLRDYVANSLAIAQKYNEQIEYIATHNPATPEDVEKTEDMLTDLLIKDGQLLDATIAKQEEMVKKHDLEFE